MLEINRRSVSVTHYSTEGHTMKKSWVGEKGLSVFPYSTTQSNKSKMPNLHSIQKNKGIREEMSNQLLRSHDIKVFTLVFTHAFPAANSGWINWLGQRLTSFFNFKM